MTKEFAGDKVMDYDAIVKDYGEVADMMIVNFEQTCFDSKIGKLFEGMLEKDWVKAMQNAHTLKGSSGYVKAYPFMNAVKKFQEFIKQDCERIEYNDYNTNEDRPQYRLLDSFTDEKKLQAYEYFHPIVEQAQSLKRELAKYSKSPISDSLYMLEADKIRSMHEEFKKQLFLNKRDKNSQYLQSMKSLTSKQVNASGTQNFLGSSMVDAVQVDPPQQNNNCCEKCVIF